MVNKVFKTGVIISLLICIFLVSCDNDFVGLFNATSLEDRLKERNNFTYLESNADALSPSFGDAYSFIVVSDTHFLNGNSNGFEGFKEMLAIDGSIQFIIILGDITQGGYREDVQKFIEMSHYMGIPVYPVIGNHDIYFWNWDNWKEIIGSTRYRIDDDGNTTLLILDSANGYLGKEQLDWLENQIKTAKSNVFVFTHFHLFIDSPINITPLTEKRERARLLSILKGRCDIMFMGHVHKYTNVEIGGVKYITLPAFVENKGFIHVSVNNNRISYYSGSL